MIALLLATVACTNQADAQSTYLPQYQSFTGTQSFNGRLAAAPQLNPSTVYSPPTYSPPTSNLYVGQSQTPSTFLTPQLPTANSYNVSQPAVYQRTLYPQKTIASPFSYHPNTAQTPACQGGS